MSMARNTNAIAELESEDKMINAVFTLVNSIAILVVLMIMTNHIKHHH